MNDNDIIKALEICVNHSCYIDGCPFMFDECGAETRVEECLFKMIECASGLAKRQRAEIADLKAKKKMCAEVIARQDKEIENLSKAVDNYESCLKCVEVIRANAIKEFAERLKNNIDLYRYVEEYYVNAEFCYEVRQDLFNDEIDSLVKEMTEEQS